MFNRQTCLWMGDLDPYMDENFIKQAFTGMGEAPLGVKIITHKITGSNSAGYCFVEFADEASVDRCVQRLNGKLVPASNPPRKFKLNFAATGKRLEAGPEYSVFVGDLASEIDDYQLHQVFKKYPSCKGAKVVTDQYGYSRGYGFVKFGDEEEQKKAIEECQGSKLGGKPLRLSVAVAKSQKMSGYQGSQAQSYNGGYSHPPPGYYGGQMAGHAGYYPQWGGYDQYGGYSSAYNSAYNSGYNSGYNYYGYPPPGHMMVPPPAEMPPADTAGAAEQTQGETEAGEEEHTEVPNTECDVEQWNKDFIQRGEELYDSLMDCHWDHLDSVDSPIPSQSG
ncbi:tRNA selenocysteine 1-associated protein 1-like isoform X1 [Synchiropus splendidus]|uniref:tRNA selenocysteine 1-associated protein 1-like isoform X1 n=1 Tax=Synchiropus splendidus TaxID=270530 RepID=UPI00237E8262|nr:tRNA selenocysteine 1-associated protein 1-like isoform X1 [Synchiropus splendidus]